MKFTKMHGLGNDFVVIDAINQEMNLTPDQVRSLANRRFGVGCDQVLLVEQAKTQGIDFRYRIFNADGNEVEQCGNGARCFARYVRDKGLIDSDVIKVETKVGVISLEIDPQGEVTVDMGAPVLEPDDIPFLADHRAITYEITVDSQRLQISAVSVGNPHAVLQVDNVDMAPVAHLGPRIQSHSRFPNQVNVGFMQVVDSNHIRLRVYERGAGETLACGTGACAAVVAGCIQGLLDQRVSVELPGGRLIIVWTGEGRAVMMKGPAAQVFEGVMEL